MHNLKTNFGEDKQTKSICRINKKDKHDADPLVDLEIEGLQVSIMTRDTWKQLGKPRLHKFDIYLKLSDQGVIKPIGV